ncbi:hypothetical protein ACFVT6_19490 [Streptomyces sp. NPDC058049]|uniref:hypothetical protein n=1 Tax=Streptomyces sp. NPDC058049 TaxID=3346314 RepID=UPI0036E98A21
MVETAGYLPLPLTAEDYLELLPARWQAVNSYCIKIKHRIYNCEGLDGLRRGEVRDHRTGGPVGGPP